MTARATIGLLATAGALLLAVWADTVLTRGRPVLPARPLPTPAEPPLLHGSIDRVARVEWTRDSERLTLVRTSTGWRDASGHPWSAEVVDAALGTLASLHPTTVVGSEPVDLAQYGLAPPRERLELSDDGGRALLAMDIGNRNPAWTGCYARRDGRDEVLLVGALLRWEIEKLRSVHRDTNQP